MRLKELAEALDLEVRTWPQGLEAEVRGGYASDLMSDVMAHAEKGYLWVTLQTHANTVAVAAMKELAGIVLTGGRNPEADTARKAQDKGITILVSALPAFELVGRLYRLGVRGREPDAEGS